MKVRTMSLRKALQQYPIAESKIIGRGRRRSAQVLALLALEDGKVLVFNPCCGHHVETDKCYANANFRKVAREQGFTVKIWHSEGAMIVHKGG